MIHRTFQTIMNVIQAAMSGNTESAKLGLQCPLIQTYSKIVLKWAGLFSDMLYIFVVLQQELLDQILTLSSSVDVSPLRGKLYHNPKRPSRD